MEVEQKKMHINHPKGVNPKMRERKLRSGVIWQGDLKQKDIKQRGVKKGLGVPIFFLYLNKEAEIGKKTG